MIDGKFLSCIVTAAGPGQRMKSKINKPYIEVGGRKILEITLDTITKINLFDEIILVIRKDDNLLVEEILKKYDKNIRYVYGKNTRELSTFEGLKALDPRSDLVLTHDGVRPFASPELFLKTIASLRENKAVITATKSKDTVKIVNDDMYVDFTPNRDYVYNIQTPQAFDKKLIVSMYEKYLESEFKVTDDSQLFEFFDRDEGVKVVHGEYSNIKITTQEDIIFANAYLLREKDV